MAQDIQIFKAVSDLEVREFLLHRLLKEKEVIIIRDKHDRELEISPAAIDAEGFILCALPDNFMLDTQKEQFVASFNLGSERYLFETYPAVTEDHIRLSLTYLFHLQRRKSFRFLLPDNYSAEFVVQSLNQTEAHYDCRLIDLSTDGCGIEYSKCPDFNLEDSVHAKIRLGNHAPFIVHGIVKNIRLKEHALMIGVEFIRVTSDVETKINTAIMDFQRELFDRRSVS